MSHLLHLLVCAPGTSLERADAGLVSQTPGQSNTPHARTPGQGTPSPAKRSKALTHPCLLGPSVQQQDEQTLLTSPACTGADSTSSVTFFKAMCVSNRGFPTRKFSAFKRTPVYKASI